MEIEPDLIEKMALVKAGSYTRYDTGIRQVGVSAQSFMEALRDAVEQNPDNGLLSVSYGNAALVTCIALCRRILELEAKIDGKMD